jgi:hypothetical protein
MNKIMEAKVACCPWIVVAVLSDVLLGPKCVNKTMKAKTKCCPLILAGVCVEQEGWFFVQPIVVLRFASPMYFFALWLFMTKPIVEECPLLHGGYFEKAQADLLLLRNSECM